MSHFITRSAGEPCALCNEKSTHKIGEEIMSDEPCMECGEIFISDAISPERAKAAKEKCKSFFHFAGPGSQRHNLTAYVCCGCFTKILGPATGCPVKSEKKTEEKPWRPHDAQ